MLGTVSAAFPAEELTLGRGQLDQGSVGGTKRPPGPDHEQALPVLAGRVASAALVHVVDQVFSVALFDSESDDTDMRRVLQTGRDGRTRILLETVAGTLETDLLGMCHLALFLGEDDGQVHPGLIPGKKSPTHKKINYFTSYFVITN